MARPRFARRPLSLLLCIATCIKCFQIADAHGYLLQPAARNWVAHTAGQFWNEASGNGLGQGNQSPPGVCGDPFQTTNSNFVNEPSQIQATYRQGSAIDLKVILTTNHGGKFTFRVCPRRNHLDEACFGNNYLTRVDSGQRDTWVMHDGREFTMRYRLPPGVVCEGGCVLQWDYFSMQSCVEPGCDRKHCGVYADGDNAVYRSNPGFCGRTQARPEFFRNCADIRILPTSNTAALLAEPAGDEAQLAAAEATAAITHEATGATTPEATAAITPEATAAITPEATAATEDEFDTVISP